MSTLIQDGLRQYEETRRYRRRRGKQGAARRHTASQPKPDKRLVKRYRPKPRLVWVNPNPPA